MSDFWPHWFRPLWLLLVPLFGWLLWLLWHREKRAGRWQMILPPAFHAVLLGGGRGHSSKLPWVALGLAWTLALLALLGPSWQRVEQTTQKPADPLVVMLELTPQMLADDLVPSRLEQARRKLMDLLQSRRDAQTALIVYAGSAHVLVPLSDDLATSRNLLDALKPSIMPQSGHRADLAVEKGLTLLHQSDLGVGRLLLITSSLDEQEREGILKRLDSQAPRLLVLGIGTREGAPVKAEGGGFLKDAQGAILMPKLDSAALKEFVGEVGGLYRQARADNDDLRELGLLDGPQALRSNGQTVQLDSWADQGYWFLVPLLLLAACAGRRGWLFCLPLLWCLPQPSYAASLEDLWRRPDQQGQYLLEHGQPAEAARRFEDPQWQGVALYQAGDFAGAAQRFAEGNSAADHYNRGNALALSGELEAALDAYEQALERQPDLSVAQQNKALVERLLKENREREQARQAAAQKQQAQQQANQGPAEQNAQSDAAASQQQAQNEADAAAQPDPDKQPGDNAKPAPASDSPKDEGGAGKTADEPIAFAPQRPTGDTLDGEQRQALEQWLRQIPDNPSELLRRKFWYEQQQHQEKTR
ncbi:MAG: VWA domain-containing protein [Pseudomonas sp.]|uniref:VWA domain-containing protein n=1 Tax=Pseudomonas abieticivorans TaxID=2931382 RepID=UPI0020C05681|nr:VWA domain-containing protein [Pseudomonas sp. PIA16]MDE1165674.1 VWA domain-containing protein [Pseudomonas sp.]